MPPPLAQPPRAAAPSHSRPAATSNAQHRRQIDHRPGPLPTGTATLPPQVQTSCTTISSPTASAICRHSPKREKLPSISAAKPSKRRRHRQKRAGQPAVAFLQQAAPRLPRSPPCALGSAASRSGVDSASSAHLRRAAHGRPDPPRSSVKSANRVTASRSSVARQRLRRRRRPSPASAPPRPAPERPSAPYGSRRSAVAALIGQEEVEQFARLGDLADVQRDALGRMHELRRRSETAP